MAQQRYPAFGGTKQVGSSTESWKPAEVGSLGSQKAGVTSVNGLIYEVGGDLGVDSRTREYDPATETFTVLEDLNERRSFPSLLTWTNNGNTRIVAAGGLKDFSDPSKGDALASVEENLLDGAGWQSFADLPIKTWRAGATISGSFGNKPVISGGLNNDVDEPTDALATTQIYVPGPITGGWQEPPDLTLPNPRWGHALVTDPANSEGFYVFGGEPDDTLKFDPTTYITKASMPETRKVGVGAATYEGEIWVCGGSTDTGTDRTKTVQIYDYANDSWRLGPPMTTARSVLGVEVVDSNPHAIGGVDPATTTPNDAIEFLTPWTEAFTADATQLVVFSAGFGKARKASTGDTFSPGSTFFVNPGETIEYFSSDPNAEFYRV